MTQDKKVDESWKESVRKEKSTLSDTPPEAEPQSSDFLGFVSTLAMQAMMALGEIPHPQTQENLQDLPQARYLIDTLKLLAEKTKGNLTPQEENDMKNLLYELQVKFVKKTQETP